MEIVGLMNKRGYDKNIFSFYRYIPKKWSKHISYVRRYDLKMKFLIERRDTWIMNSTLCKKLIKRATYIYLILVMKILYITWYMCIYIYIHTYSVHLLEFFTSNLSTKLARYTFSNLDDQTFNNSWLI